MQYVSRNCLSIFTSCGCARIEPGICFFGNFYAEIKQLTHSYSFFNRLNNTRTPKKTLGATLKLKAQPSQGVALEKALCTETVCAAGKTGYLNYSCGFALANAAHLIGQTIMRMRVNVWAKLVRCDLPIVYFAQWQNPIARHFFITIKPVINV